jgi:hypothetical protein
MIVSRLLGHLQTLFAPGLLDEHRKGLEQIHHRLPWDEANHVSSHNDPNSRNILFDGTRLWLVDWETAFRNERFADLAILVDSLAPSPELEHELLHACLALRLHLNKRTNSLP